MIIVLLAALCASPTPVADSKNAPTAQDSLDVLRTWKGDLRHVAVGQWVTYELSRPRFKGFMRISAVGEEKDAQGRDAIWVEMDVGEHHLMKAPHLQYKMLVARDAGLTANGVTRAFIAVGYERPRELETDAIAELFAEPPPRPMLESKVAPPKTLAGFNVRSEQGKPTALMTHAGTVTASAYSLYYKATVIKRIWVSPQIPILHLAKIELPPVGTAMEIRDYGVGARPMMTTPVKDGRKWPMEAFNPDLPQWFDAPPDLDQNVDGGIK